MSTNVTFDDRDQDHLRYRGFWFLTGSWNASSVGETGTLSSTNNPNTNPANVTFTFPTPAVAFYYYGIPRSAGGQYGICIDCDPNNPVFIPIDGVNRTDDGRNPPIVLFSTHFGEAGVHEVILRNEPDPRFGGNSQLTVDRFVLEVVDSVGSSKGSLTATATASLSSSSHSASVGASSSSLSLTSDTSKSGSTSPSSPSFSSSFPFSPPITSIPHSTTNATAPASNDSAAPSTIPTGAIVGSALGGLALILSLLLLLFWMRIRRQKATATLSAQHQRDGPFDGSHHARPLAYRSPVHDLLGSSITTYTPPRSEKGVVQVQGVQRRYQPQCKIQPSVSTHSDATSPSTNNSSTTSAPTSSSTHSSSGLNVVPRPRREQDAGPVFLPEEEESNLGDTLPPEYASVFSTRRSMVRRAVRF